MAGFFSFLRCVGRAAVKNGVRALANLVPFGEVVFDMARDFYEDYRQVHDACAPRTDLARLAQVAPAEGVAAQEAAGQPLEERLSLVSYRTEVPAVDEEQPPVTVSGPQRTYTLLGLLAAGDVADVHLARAGDDCGTAAETRYALKVARVPGGDTLLANEHTALADLLAAADDTTYRAYLPALVESFPARDRFSKRVNVFRHEPGFYTLEQVHARHPVLDGCQLAWIFKRLLTVLGFSHRQGIVHGAVLPCHVLLHTVDHGLQLIGWGQSVPTGGQVRVLATRSRDWYPPEVHDKQPVSPATDLFLAARCLIYLAGGDPVHDRMPEAVPAPLRRFVKSCLLPGVRMRPDDAWQLQDEFDDLLRQLYGPPKFHPLIMT